MKTFMRKGILKNSQERSCNFIDNVFNDGNSDPDKLVYMMLATLNGDLTLKRRSRILRDIETKKGPKFKPSMERKCSFVY